MNLLELFAPINTFVFDVDGVVTDGSLLMTDDGLLLRSMNIKDVYALQQAIKKGYNVWIITNAKCEAVSMRLRKMGVREVHIGVDNKKEFLQEIASATKTKREAILYMGDDIPDYEAMQICGLPCCPADAVDEIKEIAAYISPKTGGKGCVRDVIEKVLKLNRQWDLK